MRKAHGRGRMFNGIEYVLSGHYFTKRAAKKAAARAKQDGESFRIQKIGKSYFLYTAEKEYILDGGVVRRV
jgi:hypothetical protein